MSDSMQALRAGWLRVKFGDVARQVNDKVAPETSGLERYIAGDHMDTDDLRIRRWGEIGSGYLGPAFHMRFQPGHILYGSRRTYLRKVAIADFAGICANTTFVIETRDASVLLPEYLPFVMQTETFHAHSIKQSKGSVNPYINFSDLTWYEFLLPSIKAQENAIALLGEILDAREELGTSLAALNVVERSGISHVLGPEGAWRLGTMRSVVLRIEVGKSPKGSSEPASDSEAGVLKVSAVGADGFHPDENKALLDVSDFVPAAEVRRGDFLATRSNAKPQGIARTCIVDQTRAKLMLCDKTWRIVFRPDAPSSRFILAWTKLPTFRNFVETQCSGTEAKNLPQEKFLDAPMVLLTEEQRAKIDNMLIDIDAKRALLVQRAAVTDTLYRQILKKITGASQ